MSAKEKAKEKRKKLLAIVHIAKKQMRVCEGCGEIRFHERCPVCNAETRDATDFDYRRFLKSITGQHTAKNLNNAQLILVIRRMESRGFERVVKKKLLIEAANESRFAMVRRIKNDAERYLGQNWQRRVRGYCKKAFKKDDLSFCSFEELRGVWGFMRRAK